MNSKAFSLHNAPLFAPTVVISNLWPSIEGGRYPVKRIAGEQLEVWADIFRDGHGVLAAVLKWRRRGVSAWEEAPMKLRENDRWSGSFTVMELGDWEYTIEAWQDEFKTWLHDYQKKHAARGPSDSLQTEIIEGAMLLERSASLAEQAGQAKDAQTLLDAAGYLRQADEDRALTLVLGSELRRLMERWTDRSLSTTAAPLHPVIVERERARFSSWYEFFPRSATGHGSRHDTFRDCLPRIRYAKDLGFDVVYFPPIHPIGRTFRKGKDNSLLCEQSDPGSPWAIGAREGGHYDVHPDLGTLEDFDWLVTESRKMGVEIALDFAINCSPDHPYVKEHPHWFFHRPDGTIKYAENPPKKYQDIYPLNFHCEDWQNLWKEMVRVVLFWIGHGVRIFRVDNPHTKPVAFWEYLMDEIRAQHPDVIFLAEAFTRPRMMEMLGKVGFSQSYTYFTWRTRKQEIVDYVNELALSPVREYFRGNFWPNTPDILVPPLVDGTPAAFQIRAILAATLMPSWGIYSGFEFCENAKHPDRDEYRDNEKYQLKARDWDQPGIKACIRRLNQIRQSHPALEETSNITFIPSSNEQVIAYVKKSSHGSDALLIVINLDPLQRQDSDLDLPLRELGITQPSPAFSVRDLLHDEVYSWRGSKSWVSLDPLTKPAHILQVEVA